MERLNARLVIEVEPGEPVSGWVAREGGAANRFEGLLAFVSLFDQLRRDEDPRPHSDTAELDPPSKG